MTHTFNFSKNLRSVNPKRRAESRKRRTEEIIGKENVSYETAARIESLHYALDFFLPAGILVLVAAGIGFKKVKAYIDTYDAYIKKIQEKLQKKNYTVAPFIKWHKILNGLYFLTIGIIGIALGLFYIIQMNKLLYPCVVWYVRTFP